MSISPFGIVLLIYIFALFLLNNDLKAIYIKIFNLFLITALCIRMGYFFRVGSRFYSYSNILLYVVLLISIVLLKGKRLSVKEMCAFFAMLAVFAVNFVSEICIPFKEPIVTNWTKYVCTLTNYVRFSNFYTYVSANKIKIGNYLQFFLLMIIIYLYKKIVDMEDNIVLLGKIVQYGKVVIAFAGFDVIFKNLFHSDFISKIAVMFFGNVGIQQHSGLNQRGRLYEITGTAQEASMLNMCLFYLAIFFLIERKRTNDNKQRSRISIWLALDMIILALNPSLSAYVYIGILFVAVYIGVFNNKISFSAQICRLLGGCGIGILCLNIIQNLITKFPDHYLLSRIKFAWEMITVMMGPSSGWIYSSEAIRFIGIIQSVRWLLQRPLFGLGLGQLTCDSGVFTLLSNIGLAGSGVWFYIIYRMGKLTNRDSFKYFCFYLTVYIIPNLFLNDITIMYWFPLAMVMFLYSFAIINKEETVKT